MTERIDLTELEPNELRRAIEDFGSPAYHASQIYHWIYKRGITNFNQMTDLSVDLRTILCQKSIINTPQIDERKTSNDGTEKFLIGLRDNRQIESVFIPDTPRQTFCVSTQVGCAMRCGFCLTGRMGLARNLSAGEIVAQVRILSRAVNLENTTFNVVLMGMGEPLHNYDATLKAIRILCAKSGYSMTPRRITLSTVGIPEALIRLAKEPTIPNLAVSLHAATNELREQLVPVNRAQNLEDIIRACRHFPVSRHRRITFEYVLLSGVNDSVDDAKQLASLLRGIRSKVNLIPLNEAPAIPYSRPTDVRVDLFSHELSTNGIAVSVRKSRGRDIRAACGQLITTGTVYSPAQNVAAHMSKDS